MEVTWWQTIITISAVVTAIITIFKQYNRGYDMIKHQEEQDQAIAELSKRHSDDEKRRDAMRDEDKRRMNEELQLLTYGILACLKGLQEQGCDGDVTTAINRFEKHLNEKAHS